MTFDEIMQHVWRALPLLLLSAFVAGLTLGRTLLASGQ